MDTCASYLAKSKCSTYPYRKAGHQDLSDNQDFAHRPSHLFSALTECPGLGLVFNFVQAKEESFEIFRPPEHLLPQGLLAGSCELQ